MRFSVPALFGAFLLLPAFVSLSDVAKADDLGGFEGTYVGMSEELDSSGHTVAARHVDMMLNMVNDGFRFDIVSVRLVDGRRDLPGVRRRAVSVEFEETDTPGMYVADAPVNMFSEQEDESVFAGKPIEWAQVDGDNLVVYTLSIREDGRYEVEVFERAFEGDTVQTLYERHLDGALQRQTLGRMVRSE